MTTTSTSILFRWSGSAMVGRNRKAMRKGDVDFIPSIDQAQYYDTVSPRSSPEPDEPSASEMTTNSGNKLHPIARFSRRGKIYAWGPLTEDARQKEHVRGRLKICLDQFMPDASHEAGRPVPDNLMSQIKQRQERKRKREEDEQWILPHLRDASPPVTTDALAPMLAVPTSYLDITTSASMRHTLGDDTIEQGLQRTTADLLEGEKPLMQSLGRLRDILRTMERSDTSAFVNDHSADDEALIDNGPIVELPFISDTDNLWRVTQELTVGQAPPSIVYHAAPPSAGSRSLPPANLTQVQRLFTCPNGIILASVPQSSSESDGAPSTSVRYRINMQKQVTAVNDAMERISELLADCNEYKDRLEEVRERIADVARARKKVWSVIKERAGQELDRLEGKPEADYPPQLL